jgi:hypothetical protein
MNHFFNPIFSLVYKWFQTVYRVTFAVAAAGQLVFILILFNISQLVMDIESATDLSIHLLFYGLYFG